MSCTNCGSPDVAPNGWCGTCGHVSAQAPGTPNISIPSPWSQQAAAQPAAVAEPSPWAQPEAQWAPPTQQQQWNHAEPAWQTDATTQFATASEAATAPSGLQSYGVTASPPPAPEGLQSYRLAAPQPPQYSPPPQQQYNPEPPQPYTPTPQPYGTPPLAYAPPPTYGQPGMLPYQTPFPGYTAARSAGNVLSIVSFVLAAVGVLVLPIVFGTAAIVCGIIGLHRGERLGKLALILSIVALVGSVAITVLLFGLAHLI